MYVYLQCRITPIPLSFPFSPPLVPALLAECDQLRDKTLPELGVRMEDKEDTTVVKLVGREAALREKEREREVRAVMEYKKWAEIE